ncbi:tetratricopeptide repeat protein [Phenylobacterium sp.]|jgi:tetratricopeptide (TPR) repeat protein|uniref:tetratricopeptide repeat protein n=1 Tax=Phenylobacterium sp. TaxID=1871053 RepID=UPI002F95026C
MNTADAEPLFRSALARLKAGDPTGGLAELDRLLAARPQHVGALVSRGSALAAVGRADEAEGSFRAALDLQPGQPTALWNLGLLLIEREAFEAALALAQAALDANPANTTARLLLGDALTGLGRFEAACDAYRAVPPDDPEARPARSKLGQALAAIGDPAAALPLLDAAVAADPQDAFARYRRGIVRLSLGDFAGWPDYEHRWKTKPFLARSAGVVAPALAPRLALAPTKADLAGQRVLLLGEQGIGDQIMFASMVPDLLEVARSVTCVAEPRLERLFAGSFATGLFTGPAQARVRQGDVDRIVALGSLGCAFRPDRASFPGRPYLRPSAEAQGRWAARLGPRTTRLRIGLSWRGGVATTGRTRRSLDLHQLRPLLALEDCEVVSLQYGEVAEELAQANAGLARPIRSFAADELGDMDDLAALAAQLDAVVSVQTALAHLCGAIGQTCLVLLPSTPEWRYGAEGSEMPWYGSVRLYRQTERGEWGPVVEEVVHAVRHGSTA